MNVKTVNETNFEIKNIRVVSLYSLREYKTHADLYRDGELYMKGKTLEHIEGHLLEMYTAQEEAQRILNEIKAEEEAAQ